MCCDNTDAKGCITIYEALRQKPSRLRFFLPRFANHLQERSNGFISDSSDGEPRRFAGAVLPIAWGDARVSGAQPKRRGDYRTVFQVGTCAVCGWMGKLKHGEQSGPPLMRRHVVPGRPKGAVCDGSGARPVGMSA